MSRTNNNPNVVANFFLECVCEQGGCPYTVQSDCGTENVIVAALQSYFSDSENAHVYGSSHHNQRIEAWRSFFRRNRTSWWINFFKDMVQRTELTPGNTIQEECLWFCFHPLLQKDLDELKVHWNTHYIRDSNHSNVSGRPDELYHLPEFYGVEECITSVTDDDVDYSLEHFIENVDETNEFQEYFLYEQPI